MGSTLAEVGLFDVRSINLVKFQIDLCNGFTSYLLPFIYRILCQFFCSLLLYSPRSNKHFQPTWATLSTLVISAFSILLQPWFL